VAVIQQIIIYFSMQVGMLINTLGQAFIHNGMKSNVKMVEFISGGM
jgi:hypothetical protein